MINILKTSWSIAAFCSLFSYPDKSCIHYLDVIDLLLALFLHLIDYTNSDCKGMHLQGDHLKPIQQLTPFLKNEVLSAQERIVRKCCVCKRIKQNPFYDNLIGMVFRKWWIEFAKKKNFRQVCIVHTYSCRNRVKVALIFCWERKTEIH